MSDVAAAGPAHILRAGIDLAEEMAHLHASLFDAAWDAESFRRLLGHANPCAFVARAGDPPAVAGFILGRVAADEAEILALGVAAKWQRRGIGRRLVEALGRAARTAQARRLHLEVGASNAPACALYRGLGFQENGRRKGYYVHPGRAAEDAINLSLAL
jgi:ribosomal-protein-alanine N-acetyltransferase